MWRASPLALGVVLVFANLSHALEFKHVRAAYGAPGPTRPDNKFQPGDFVCLVFDIEGLKIDPKKLEASYNISFDFIDAGGNSIQKKETPQEVFPGLGGNSMPGVVMMLVPLKQTPGMYTVRVSVLDKNAKQSKSFDYALEVVPPQFGIIAIAAPAVSFPGGEYKAHFAFVNMGLDGKKKPSVDIAINILDESGKGVVPAAKLSFPEALPGDFDLQKENFVPYNFPVICNRAGRFTIAVEAHDKNANKKTQMRIPLTVLDLSKFGGDPAAIR